MAIIIEVNFLYIYLFLSSNINNYAVVKKKKKNTFTENKLKGMKETEITS